MIWKKSEERRIVWWNLLSLLAMTGLSFALINAEESFLFYALLSALFICVGIFIKRPYVFLGILIFVLVFVFIAKDGFFGIFSDGSGGGFNFDFFINSNN